MYMVFRFPSAFNHSKPARDRKLFYRTVIGLLVFGTVTIGLRAASHIVTRFDPTVVAHTTVKDYQVTATAYPINPNDKILVDGTHSDGYYYVCNVAHNGMPLSAYTLKPWKGFHATDVQVEYLQTLRSNGVTMLDVTFNTVNAGSMCAYCKIWKSGTGENYGAEKVEWSGLTFSGV